MNRFWSIIFIIGIIYIGIVSGCSVKNVDPKDVKKNTSDLKKELSSDKSSSLEKSIEPPEDLTRFSNPEEQSLLEETLLDDGSVQKKFKQEPNSKKQSNPFLDAGNSAQKNVMPTLSAGETLNSVFFDYDKHSLSKAAKKILIKNADWLKKDPSLKIQLEGYCDERGTNNYNLALGVKRAHKVKRELEVLGIDKDRMLTVSYGEEKPFCSERTESCWSQNRRVQFLIR
tara:strand:+ start:343 stop:1026 length:684 start_codon:yes stop_codon:yes gene_type:complete